MSTTEPKNRKPAAERRYSREHNNQHRTQLFSAVVLILVGCLLLVGGVGSVEDMMAMQEGKPSLVSKLVDGGDISARTSPALTQYF